MAACTQQSHVDIEELIRVNEEVKYYSFTVSLQQNFAGEMMSYTESGEVDRENSIIKTPENIIIANTSYSYMFDYWIAWPLDDISEEIFELDIYIAVLEGLRESTGTIQKEDERIVIQHEVVSEKHIANFMDETFVMLQQFNSSPSVIQTLYFNTDTLLLEQSIIRYEAYSSLLNEYLTAEHVFTFTNHSFTVQDIDVSEMAHSISMEELQEILANEWAPTEQR